MNFLKDVVGIRMDVYRISFERVDRRISEISGRMETFFDIRLNSGGGELCATLIFVDVNLCFFGLEKFSNAPVVLNYSSRDCLYIAKRALEQYQLSFNKAYCTKFAKMIQNVNTLQNRTIKTEDVALTLLCTEFYTSLSWCHTVDGIEVPHKAFSMSISKQGFIERFSDCWEINKIATTNIKVSREEALNRAFSMAKSYADKIGTKIMANETTLHFTRDVARRRGDSYMIYPIWIVQFEFDRILEDIYGYSVGIWADNGEICHDAPEGFYGRSATILGSRHIVLDDDELQLRQNITLLINQTVDDDAAYDAIYYLYGSNTTKGNIFNAAEGAGRNYSISFYIGHGGMNYSYAPGEKHYYIYADNGQKVYDIEIYKYSKNQNVRFAFLWSCSQADEIGGTYNNTLNPYGMPHAWVHTIDLSMDGYVNPDGKGYTFVGFNGYSPYLTDTLNGTVNACYLFLYHFYDVALHNRSCTINLSLDYAAHQVWGNVTHFDQCILYKGYDLSSRTGDEGKMVVYGDGSMRLGTWQLAVRTYDIAAYPYAEIYNVTVWVDGIELRSPLVIGVAEGVHNISVGLRWYSCDGESIYNFTFWEDNSTNNSRFVNVTGDTSLIAYYYYAESNEPPLTPQQPSGNTSIYTDQPYTYTTNTTDPELDMVCYNFSWGDGTYTLTEWCNSGEIASASHTWDLGGTYNITVKAKDPGGKWSNWSLQLVVSTVNRPPSVPLKPWCHTYTGYPGVSYTWSTSTTDLEGDDVYYLFDWGDGSTSLIGPYASDITVSATHVWSTIGTYYVKVKAKDVYALWSDWSPSQTMNIVEPPPPGGCPFIYIWNGIDYAVDNNVLPAAEDSGGVDVGDCYVVQQRLTPTFQGAYYAIYSLKLCEFGQEHDYIDRVRLFAVDHAVGVNVAVSPYGEILTYANPASPTTAVDNNGIDVLSLLNAMDGSYYQGYNGSYVTLTFAGADVSNGAKLVIREDGPVRKCPIHVQVLNVSGYWENVATFYTRHYWTTDIINMTTRLPDAEGKMRVRLYFVDIDRIDYVGLDTSPQAQIQTHEAYLVSAVHSEQGYVTLKLLCNDNIYAELTPEQQIKLTFIVITQQSQARTFIFYAEGHYYTITR